MSSPAEILPALVALRVYPPAAAVGGGEGASVSDATPADTGTPSAGASALASRADHVHAVGAGTITNASVAAGAAIAESKLSLASDAAAGTPSRRTLGTGATQAAAGNDSRFTDQRTPTDGSVTDAKVAAGAAIAESKLSLASDAAAGTPSRRTLGTGATQACAGNDSRLSNSRAPTGAAGGQLGGTYPNPDVRGLRETSGPTELTIGAVGDGQVLQRVGNTLVGVNFVGGTPVAYADLTAPLAVANPGAIALATGIGNVTYVPFISDGVNWRVLGGRQLIYQRNVSQTLTGNGASSQVFTDYNTTILANLLTLTRYLRFEAKVDYGAPGGTASNNFSIQLASVATYVNSLGTTRQLGIDFKIWPNATLNSLRHQSAGANSIGLGSSTGNPDPNVETIDATASMSVEFLAQSASGDLANLRNAQIWLEGY